MSGEKALAVLVAETYTEHEPKFFVFCDDGNGCAFGEGGQALEYNAEAAARYGSVVLRPTPPHISADRVKCRWASDWVEGNNGYRYQIRF